MIHVEGIIAGHVTRDKVITWNGVSNRLGGPPSYICSVSSVLGLNLDVMTRIGPDFPSEYHNRFSEWGFNLDKWRCKETTTSFTLDYTETPRGLSVPSICEGITLGDESFESLLLSPIAGELSEEEVMSVDSGFTALDPQGFIRRVDSQNRVFLSPWNPETLGNIDLLKSSEGEHSFLTGEDNPIRSLRKLFKKGVGVSVITMGERGSLVYTGEKLLKTPAYPTNPVDLTGAGDCYLGSMFDSIIRGCSIEWATAMASAVSSAIIETLGPQLMVSGDELVERAEQIIEQVKEIA